MKFVKRKVTTAESKHSFVDFDRLKKAFLKDIVTTVEMEEIPAEMIGIRPGSRLNHPILSPWMTEVPS